jgi:hypothetical protein
MTLELEARETGQMTAPPPRAGLDLNAYLAAHSGDMALMLLIATAITIGHWRYWFYPDEMTLPDGKTRHPLAGTLNCKRVIGDFLFMPTGIVLGWWCWAFRSAWRWPAPWWCSWCLSVRHS